MKIYVIIPTYNEKENIERLAQEIFGLKIEGLKLLIVDDNSPDGTGEIADRMSQSLPVEVLHRQGKQGLGSAYRAGFKYCLENKADFVFEMDADFSHQPKDIPRLLAAAKSGADLAIGSRKVKGGQIIGWNLWRHFCSDGAMLASRIILGIKIHDVTAGFRCFRAAALEKIKFNELTSNGYAFQIEMVFRLEKAGMRVTEVPVVFPDRERGSSKLNKKDIIEFFKKVVSLRFRKL